MFSAKGLPKENEVKAFLALSCWKVNGKFSMELMRVFSSMFHGKGLPKQGAVEAFLTRTLSPVLGWASLC
jgi:hypothetical protein